MNDFRSLIRAVKLETSKHKQLNDEVSFFIGAVIFLVFFSIQYK